MTLVPLNLSKVLSSPPPALDFVLPGLPAGAVGALVAPGSSGKSFFTLQLAAALALGIPVAGGALPAPTKTGKTVLLASEESRAMLAVRLHALIAWLESANDFLPLEERIERERVVAVLSEHLQVYPLAGETIRLLEDGVVTPRLGEIAELCEGARLVVIDPLRRFHSGDENGSADMTAIVQAIESITHRTGCAALITHHTNKAATLSGNGDIQQAIRGSSALTDAIRWQANLVAMSETEAERFSVDANKRKYFVRLELSKANYIEPTAGVWMRRQLGGCLERVELCERRAPRAVARGGRNG